MSVMPSPAVLDTNPPGKTTLGMDCTCHCHRVAGVLHCVPCCTPALNRDPSAVDPAFLPQTLSDILESVK